MNDDGVRFDLDGLMARVEDDPGAPEFPALAEALRRSGLVERAREVAEAGLESAPSRLAGRVALALVRMDLGELSQGRAELARVLDEMIAPYRVDVEPEAPLTPVTSADAARPQAPSADLSAVGEHEIDAAFDVAGPQTEGMHSPNTMAQSVLDAEAPFEPPSTDYDVASSRPFATRTMAGLLEQQGDHDRAASIRTSLQSEDLDAGSPVSDDEARLGAPAEVERIDRTPMTLEVDAPSDPPTAAEPRPARDALEATEPDDAGDALEATESDDASDALEASEPDDAVDALAGLDLDARDDSLASAAAGPFGDALASRFDDPPVADPPAARVSMDAAEGVRLSAVPLDLCDDPDAVEADERHRARVLATLERWLHNLQRGA
jgi:hypothetical protein